MSSVLSPRQIAGTLVIGVAMLVLARPAFGQAAAPSSVIPQMLRPPRGPATAPSIPSAADPFTPPPGAGKLVVRVSALAVDGVFPEVAGEVDALVAPFAHRSVTLEQIYAAASAIEAAHIRRGYILARVVVPPQTLRDNAPVRIVVIDGFIEAVDVSAVPRRVRGAVAQRLGGLIGRRRLKLEAIEQALVLASDVPGITLTSTLARGTRLGGTRLIIAGSQSALSGAVSVDNNLAASLGRYGVTAQLAFNSPFGQGEQIYALASSSYDLPEQSRSDAPVRVLGAGLLLPSSDGRWFVNPEITSARTQPAPTPGVPLSRGKLHRLSLRAGYTLRKSRRLNLSVGGSIEQITESNDAIDFGVRLSFDRFWVGRVQLNYSKAFAQGGGIVAFAQFSHGLGGLDDRSGIGALSFTGPSRQGAAPDFSKLNATVRVQEPVAPNVQLGLVVMAQKSFGKPLFRSEQGALEGPDALSAHTGGITAVDESLTARLELSHTDYFVILKRQIALRPYVFAAAGMGAIDNPTAQEPASLNAVNFGAGVRGSVGATGISWAAEYSYGLSRAVFLDRVDRVYISLSKSF